MQKEENVLKIYYSIYLISSLIIGVIVIATMHNVGEAAVLPMYLERIDLCVILGIHLFTLALILPFYNGTKNVKFSFFRKMDFHIAFRKERLHIFVFCVVFLQTLYVVRTGYGNAGRTFSNTYSYLTMLFNLLKIECFFPLYFVCAREKKVIYWVNTVLFLGMRLLQGWTGDILTIIVLEAYLFIKYHRNNIKINMMIRHPFVLSGGAIMFGGVLYKVLYPIKFYIRNLGDGKINYFEGVRNLVLRLTNFPIDIAAIQNNDKIRMLYELQGVKNGEVIAFFRSIIPSVLFKNKGFLTLNAVIMQTIYPDLNGSTSTDYNIFCYAYNLLSADTASFCFYCLFFVMLFLATKMLLQALDDGSKDVHALYFLLVFKCFYGCSLEIVYAYGYLGSVYIFIVLFLLGIMRVSRTDRMK